MSVFENDGKLSLMKYYCLRVIEGQGSIWLFQKLDVHPLKKISKTKCFLVCFFFGRKGETAWESNKKSLMIQTFFCFVLFLMFVSLFICLVCLTYSTRYNTELNGILIKLNLD